MIKADGMCFFEAKAPPNTDTKTETELDQIVTKPNTKIKTEIEPARENT